MDKTPSWWPICHCCGDHCSPTSAWVDCANDDSPQAAEDTAVRFVTRWRGRICDLSGPMLDIIAARLPKDWSSYTRLMAIRDDVAAQLAQLEEGGRT